MPADARYRAVPGDRLQRVELDALTAVYDQRSGQTHLLAPPLPDLIDALGDGEWTLSSFGAHLAEHFDLSSADTDTDTETVIAARLDELAALGLVEIR